MNRHIKYPLKTSNLTPISFNFCVKLGLRWYNLHLEQKEGNKEGGGSRKRRVDKTGPVFTGK